MKNLQNELEKKLGIQKENTIHVKSADITQDDMITFTFPDNSKKQFKNGTSGLEVAKSISEGLLRDAVAIKINGEILDLSQSIDHDGKIQILTFKDKEGVEVFRHSSAHLMAQAISELFPESKLTIGPVVEEGFYYDVDHAPFSPDDVLKIEERMKELSEKKIPIHRHILSKPEALKKFWDNIYKIELINGMEGVITAYSQGDFMDLCHGPHVQHTGQIKAFKILNVAGAYWHGDAKNKQLQRLYAISFPDKKMLADHLAFLEEAKRRDHRVIGKQLELISFQEESPGAIFYHPKGTIIFNELQKFIREQYVKRDFKEVITPLVYDKKLWETSGHWEHYKENMFVFEVEGKEVSLKPMNCPSHCLIYKTSTKSYRDLPLRIADFAMLHRNELSGALSGMMRVRKFSQDDAHIFCTIEQLKSELNNAIQFTKYVYDEVFHFEYRVELSTKPEKAMGSPDEWDAAETALKNALDQNNVPYTINPGEGTFYGPKIDVHIKDCLGRSWQVSTIQVDFQMPGRFNLEYEGTDNAKHHPVMVHRAILGSLDRFIGILIEHFAGKFPLWLSPVQAKILPIADRHNAYCQTIAEKMQAAGLRVEIDDHAETTQKKVRNAQLQQVNYLLVIGDKEIENNTVNIRKRDGTVQGERKVEDWITEMVREVKEKE